MIVTLPLTLLDSAEIDVDAARSGPVELEMKLVALVEQLTMQK